MTKHDKVPGRQRGTDGLDRSQQARRAQTFLPPPSPAPASENRVLTGRNVGYFAVFVALLAFGASLHARSAALPDTCPAPDSSANDIETQGGMVSLDTLLAVFNQTATSVTESVQHQSFAAVKQETVFADMEPLAARESKSHSRSHRKHKPRLPTPKEARVLLERQKQVDEELRARAAMDGRTRAPAAVSELESHIRFFARESELVPVNPKNPKHQALVDAINRASGCDIYAVTPVNKELMAAYRTRETSDCHWETVDTISCFSASGVTARLDELKEDASNYWKGFFISGFNLALNGFNNCPAKKDLPDTLHAGTDGLYLPDGRFNHENFDSLLAFARHVQGGRDDILLESTLTKFADVQEAYRAGDKRSKSCIPFWDSLKRWAQTQAAQKAREEVLGSSYPTSEPLTATYTTVDKDGKAVKVTEPCIQSALYMLFLADTPAYFEVAKRERSEAASSVDIETQTPSPR
ncbi:hypothetical protein E3226_000315 [Legionella geestiana]|uniref:hypothetical protein n=1 Tax=Legionella geestiana TaxID=45065 RepID=UPI0010931F02|nr:hypothetical protein [Legionella geestiana]QDQ38955.1 hypothetical protein E3226_000315 [Legionella geestiana]